MHDMARDLKPSIRLFLSIIKGSCYVVLVRKNLVFLYRSGWLLFVMKQSDKKSNTESVTLLHYKTNGRHFDL